MLGWVYQGCGVSRTSARISQHQIDLRISAQQDHFRDLNTAIEGARELLRKGASAGVPDNDVAELKRMTESGELFFEESLEAQKPMFEVESDPWTCGCDPKRPMAWMDGDFEEGLSQRVASIEAAVQKLESSDVWMSMFTDLPADSLAISSLHDSDGSRPAFVRDVLFFCVLNTSTITRRNDFMRNTCHRLILHSTLRSDILKLPGYVFDSDPYFVHVEVPTDGLSRKALDEVRNCILANVTSLVGGPEKRLKVWVVNASIFAQDELDLISQRQPPTFVVTWRRAVSESAQTALIPWLYSALEAIEVMTPAAISGVLRKVAKGIAKLECECDALYVSEPCAFALPVEAFSLPLAGGDGNCGFGSPYSAFTDEGSVGCVGYSLTRCSTSIPCVEPWDVPQIQHEHTHAKSWKGSVSQLSSSPSRGTFVDFEAG